jgi:hypothetical protein
MAIHLPMNLAGVAYSLCFYYNYDKISGFEKRNSQNLSIDSSGLEISAEELAEAMNNSRSIFQSLDFTFSSERLSSLFRSASRTVSTSSSFFTGLNRNTYGARQSDLEKNSSLYDGSSAAVPGQPVSISGGTNSERNTKGSNTSAPNKRSFFFQKNSSLTSRDSDGRNSSGTVGNTQGSNQLGRGNSFFNGRRRSDTDRASLGMVVRASGSITSMNNRDSNLARASNSVIESDVNAKPAAAEAAPTETISPMASEVVSSSTSVIQGSTASSQPTNDNGTRNNEILEVDEENL